MSKELRDKIEQPFIDRILYIGEELPDFSKDSRPKHLLLGYPDEIIKELEALIRQEKLEMLDRVESLCSDGYYLQQAVDKLKKELGDETNSN